MMLSLGLPAPLAVPAPPHTSVSSAASSSRDLDPRLRLAAPIGSSGRATCPDGQRSAREDECVAAVQEVAHALQLSVRDGLKVVDEGAKGLVPSGCSYSRHSKQALFNKNPAGGSGSDNYELACIAEAAEAHGAPSTYGLRHFREDGVFESPQLGFVRWSLDDAGNFLMHGQGAFPVARDPQTWGWVIGTRGQIEYHSVEAGATSKT